MGMYKKWNCALCKELCDAFEKFECTPTVETLCLIKEISESINNLQEMEFSGAMRHYAEEKFGYNSETGRFEKDFGEEWDDYDLGMFGVYDSVYDARRRRDSRGRFMSNRMDGRRGMRRGPYNAHYPPYYNMDDEINDDWDEYERMDEHKKMKIQNAADRRYGNMPPYHDDGNMYRVRQEGGRPMMERISAHGDKSMKPKKLTHDQYEEWAKKLENDDGTRGPHFSKQQTDEMAKKLGIDFDDFSQDAWMMAVNMMYSDYCQTIGKHVQGNDIYGKLAQDFLEDEDAKEEGDAKLAAYYYSIVE